MTTKKNLVKMALMSVATAATMMCLENLYELRSVADYIIGSPAEIPNDGAPYDQIMPDLFGEGQFYTNVITKYYKSVEGMLPLTAVKMSEMDNVAQANREAMQAVKAKIGEGYADMTGIIHYYYTGTDSAMLAKYRLFYDAGDFMQRHAPKEVYQQWKQTLDKAVVDHRNASLWDTDKGWNFGYKDFTVTDEKMHGVSMFVEQDPKMGDYAKYNEDVKQLAWYKATQS